MDQIEIREGARRQHRGLAMFCALYCWHHRKEAVFVRQKILLNYLGLEKMKGTRYEWILEDVATYFPYIFKRSNDKNDFVVFSRTQESTLLEDKNKAIHFSPKILSLATYNTLAIMDGGVDACKLIDDAMPFLSDIKNLHEYSITNALSLLASGLISPSKALE